MITPAEQPQPASQPHSQPRPQSPSQPLIVVGCADTDSGRAALMFAAQEAAARSAGLRVVLAYQASIDSDADYFEMDPDREREHYRRIAERLCAPLTRAGQDTPVPHTPAPEIVVEKGSAATVLLHASRAASLLVIGNRTHGFLARLTQTSTSAQVLNQAQLPVVVVPAPAAAATSSRAI